MKLNQIHDIKVKVSPHRSLNSCMGVITSPELSAMEEDELQKELEHAGVIKAKVITSRRNDTLSKTATIILTFKGTDLPKYIYAAYLKFKVRAYVPPPKRCFKCQKYGHLGKVCKHKALCAKCGVDFHGDTECSNPTKCVNCNGNHAAYDRSCPRFTKEKALSKIQAEEKKSYQEAKRIQEMKHQVNVSSFATAVDRNKNKFVNAETQTICKCSCTCSIEQCNGDKILTSKPRSINAELPTRFSRATSTSSLEHGQDPRQGPPHLTKGGRTSSSASFGDEDDQVRAGKGSRRKPSLSPDKKAERKNLKQTIPILPLLSLFVQYPNLKHEHSLFFPVLEQIPLSREKPSPHRFRDQIVRFLHLNSPWGRYQR